MKKNYLIVLCLIFIFLSKNNMSQNFWQLISSDTISVRTLLVNHDGDIFGSTGNNIYRSTDNGISWTQTDMGNTIYCMDINSIGYIFAGGHNGLYRSTDNGETWSIIGDTIVPLCYSIAIDENDDIFAGICFTWCLVPMDYSSDNGDTWSQLEIISSCFRDIAVNSEGHVFTVNAFYEEESGMFFSQDKGATWDKVNIPYDDNINFIRFNSDNEIFAVSNSSVIYFDGNTWTKHVFNESIINCVIINSNNHIFIGTKGGGVYYSTDNGESWHQINSGLLNTNVHALAFDSDEYIYAATEAGIFKSIQHSTILTSVKENYSEYDFDFKNYPNPFTDYTNIYFTLEKSQNISLYLYDLSGRKIKCLIDNKYYNKGNNFLTMYADDLQPGIYTLKTDKFVVNNKLIKIK